MTASTKAAVHELAKRYGDLMDSTFLDFRTSEREGQTLLRYARYDDQRKADPDGFLKTIKAVVVDGPSERGNTLYRSRQMVWGWGNSYWLRYICPSTGEVYVSGIPPRSWGETPESADRAMAWKYQLQLPDYLAIDQET